MSAVRFWSVEGDMFQEEGGAAPRVLVGGGHDLAGPVHVEGTGGGEAVGDRVARVEAGWGGGGGRGGGERGAGAGGRAWEAARPRSDSSRARWRT